MRKPVPSENCMMGDEMCIELTISIALLFISVFLSLSFIWLCLHIVFLSPFFNLLFPLLCSLSFYIFILLTLLLLPSDQRPSDFFHRSLLCSISFSICLSGEVTHIKRAMAILIYLQHDLKQINQTKGQGHLKEGSRTTQVSNRNSTTANMCCISYYGYYTKVGKMSFSV